MLKRLLASLLLLVVPSALYSAAAAEKAALKIQEETWALPFPLPLLAYVVRPLGDGPFPLVIMNHGISLGAQERSMFPAVEYRAASHWFASQGYLVISPIRYGASSLETEEHGLYGTVFAHVGGCDNPNFRGPGLAIATLNEWVIDYMSKNKLVQPGKVVVVGQSGGGWGSIALASLNPPPVRAIITFATGRGGRVDGKPNNNCAPDKLVAATGEFGRTARVPMLWIYAENDTYFGPELTKRMHQAFVEAGGDAEYRLLPAFGNDGHFMINSEDAVPLWSPLVTRFLEKHSATGAPPTQQVDRQELQTTPPRVRLPQNIQFSTWKKFCFNSSDGTTKCRTTSTGTDDLGEIVVRTDLIERPERPARLHLFVPHGANLEEGVKVTVDQNSPVQVPFSWCLTNMCIAGSRIERDLIDQMDAGKELKLELTSIDHSSVGTILRLDQFSAAHNGPPAQTFDFHPDDDQ